MDQKNILKILSETGALLEGHFELRSGLHSDRYFQCANVLAHPVLAEKLCRALVEQVRATSPDALRADVVIAPAMGGIIVGHEVARALALRSIFAEKQDGALVLRRFAVKPGERVIVAEDVITRGGRVDETIKLVTDAGGKVTAVVVLVDRSGGKARFPYPTFSLLQLEPVTYEPARCPMCAAGSRAVHPGS